MLLVHSTSSFSFMRLLLLLTLTLSLTLSGAENPPHTCRILFMNAAPAAPKKLHLFDGSSSQEVELPRMNLSPVYELAPGERTLVLSPNPYSAPEEVDPKAPAVRIPASVKDFYLLVANDSSNSVAPITLQVVPVDDSKFRKGEMLWFNLTQHQVGGKIGKQSLAMKPQSKVYLKEPASKSGDYPVKIAYRIKGKESLYPLCETKWRHDERSRTIVFVMQEKGTRTPRVMGFADFRSSPKKGK